MVLLNPFRVIKNQTASNSVPLLQAVKKAQRRGARRIDERRRTWPVRWSESIERNEAYESFLAACYGTFMIFRKSCR
jgi:hypothetical protein